MINDTEVVAGIDLIHDALLETTESPLIRKLIQDTTPDIHDQLTALASQVRDPFPDEIALFNARPPTPVPDPDTIRAEELLTNSPEVITQPEMWELLRIFGRRLGFRF